MTGPVLKITLAVLLIAMSSLAVLAQGAELAVIVTDAGGRPIEIANIEIISRTSTIKKCELVAGRSDA